MGSVLVIALLGALLALGAVAGWTKYSSDATWPTNRIASVARELAQQCPSQEIVQVMLAPRSVGVACHVAGKRVLKLWTMGEVEESIFSMPDGWVPFQLSDFDIEAAALLAEEPDVRQIRVEASGAPRAPRVLRVFENGKSQELGPNMLPR